MSEFLQLPAYELARVPLWAWWMIGNFAAAAWWVCGQVAELVVRDRCGRARRIMTRLVHAAVVVIVAWVGIILVVIFWFVELVEEAAARQHVSASVGDQIDPNYVDDGAREGPRGMIH